MADHAELMAHALAMAARAAEIGEVPVGAVVALEGKVVAAAHNEREVSRDPTAHAELLAIRRAAEVLGRWRLHDVALYVTLEPCPMCAGAIVNARIPELYYGAADPKAGAVHTLYALATDPRLNHRVTVTAGLHAEASAELLRQFFRERRRRDSNSR